MTLMKLPLTAPLKLLLKKNRKVTLDGGPGSTLAMEGPWPSWLKVGKQGGRHLTIEGTPDAKGQYAITVVMKMKVVIDVKEHTIWDTKVFEL
jgi:hypothetical protein